MSETPSSRHVATIWVVVILVGGMSIPFLRGDRRSSEPDHSIRWQEIEPSDNGPPPAPLSPSAVAASSGKANDVTSAPSDSMAGFLQSSHLSRLDEAVEANQSRPSLTKLYQPEGMPLTKIEPWIGNELRIPASSGSAASGSVAATNNSPAPNQQNFPTDSGVLASHTLEGSNSPLGQSVSRPSLTDPASTRERWPDRGFQASSQLTPNSSSTANRRLLPEVRPQDRRSPVNFISQPDRGQSGDSSTASPPANAAPSSRLVPFPD